MVGSYQVYQKWTSIKITIAIQFLSIYGGGNGRRQKLK